MGKNLTYLTRVWLDHESACFITFLSKEVALQLVSPSGICQVTPSKDRPVYNKEGISTCPVSRLGGAFPGAVILAYS